MRLFFKKPVITSPHISDQFIAYTGNTDLAILLNKDTFEPDPVVLAFREDSTSKNTWGMVLLTVRTLLRCPSLSGTPTVTFCSVHIHNLVAKKRDASTELRQRLHGNMKQHNVDSIGSDFNMSALSTVGDVFSDPEFSAPGNSFLWGLGALEEQYRERTGFLSMPKCLYEWRVDSHGCYKFDNAALGLGPRDQSAHLPVFLHLRTTYLPGPDSIMRSEHAVIHSDHCHTQFSFFAPRFWMQVPGTHSAFSVSSLLQPCHVAPPRPTMTSTTLTTISFSCLRTLTLRPLCSRA